MLSGLNGLKTPIFFVHTRDTAGSGARPKLGSNIMRSSVVSPTHPTPGSRGIFRLVSDLGPRKTAGIPHPMGKILTGKHMENPPSPNLFSRETSQPPREPPQ